jgi:hypothetical protein
MINKENNMKFTIYLSLLLLLNFTANSQVYNRSDTLLSLFKVNDSIEYFEVTTPQMSSESVMCGVLTKNTDSLFTLSYADSYRPCAFTIVVFKNSAQVKILEKDECYTSTAFKMNIFKKISTKPVPKVSTFHQKYEIVYKALKTTSLKFYEYPSFNSSTSVICVRVGSNIKIKRTVGTYKQYNPEKNNSWSYCLDENNKPLGWLLLSDKDIYFQLVKPR